METIAIPVDYLSALDAMFACYATIIITLAKVACDAEDCWICCADGGTKYFGGRCSER